MTQQAKVASQERTPARDAEVPPKMVWIPGGTFRMGPDHHYPEEAPAHRVRVDGFWIDRTPVTNGEFRMFVKATGHVTALRELEDRVHGAAGARHLKGLGGAVHPLRVRKFFDLRADPYERADVTSNIYYDWLLNHSYIIYGAQAGAARFLETSGVSSGPATCFVHDRPGD